MLFLASQGREPADLEEIPLEGIISRQLDWIDLDLVLRFQVVFEFALCGEGSASSGSISVSSDFSLP